MIFKTLNLEHKITFFNSLILTLPYLVLSQSIHTFSISLPCLSNPVTSILAGDHLE
jgi:hypothetical protein